MFVGVRVMVFSVVVVVSVFAEAKVSSAAVLFIGDAMANTSVRVECFLICFWDGR